MLQKSVARALWRLSGAGSGLLQQVVSIKLGVTALGDIHYPVSPRSNTTIGRKALPSCSEPAANCIWILPRHGWVSTRARSHQTYRP